MNQCGTDFLAGAGHQTGCCRIDRMSNFRFGLSFIDGCVSRGVDHDCRLKLENGLSYITRNTQVYLRLVQEKRLGPARQQFRESGPDLPNATENQHPDNLIAAHTTRSPISWSIGASLSLADRMGA